MGKIIDLDEGKLLIATDIHGNWTDYHAIQEKFRKQKEQGKVDTLVLAGDIVHGYAGYPDRSIEILDDLIDNPQEDILALLGNHELMHIYHQDFSKVGQNFTEPFEDKVEPDRNKYVEFFKQMPYAIRTKGGVTINHTGANPPMAGYFANDAYKHLAGPVGFNILNQLDHDKILAPLIEFTRKILEQKHGHALADDFFDDFTPQLGAVMGKTDIGIFLGEVFFNKNELQFGNERYAEFLTGFLETMSQGDRPQQYLVSGHIETPKGYSVFDNKHLRICSSHGALQENKVLGVVDASTKYESVDQLVGDLQKVHN